MSEAESNTEKDMSNVISMDAKRGKAVNSSVPSPDEVGRLMGIILETGDPRSLVELTSVTPLPQLKAYFTTNYNDLTSSEQEFLAAVIGLREEDGDAVDGTRIGQMSLDYFINRLLDEGDPNNLIVLTGHFGVSELQAYLKKNQNKLTPAEAAYLDATIRLRNSQSRR